MSRSTAQRATDLSFMLLSGFGGWLLWDGLGSGAEGPLRVPMPAGWRHAAQAALALCAVHVVVLGIRLGRGGPVRLWARLRLLLIAAVAGWTAYLATDQPFQPVRAQVTLGTLIGGFALPCLGAPLFGRWARSRPAAIAGYALTVLCLVIVGLELSLRAAAAFVRIPLLSRSDAGVTETIGTYRFPAGHLRFGFPCNSGGHYDEEFTAKQPGVPLVVNIGDSFAQGITHHTFHYTTAVERLLPPLRFHNMGLPSIGPAEYLHLLRTEAMPLRPDCVVIGVFVGNDITQRSRSRSPLLASWFNRERVQLVTVLSRLRSIWVERSRLGRDELGIVGEHSTAALAPAEVRDRYPWFLDPTSEPPTHSESVFLPMELNRARSICRARRPASDYDPFFEIIAEIVDAAGSTPLVFLIIPDVFQVDDRLWQRITADVDDELDRERPQRLLREWFEARGLTYVDLLPDMLRVPRWRDGSRHLFHHNDTHINARGNQRTAAALAPVLARILGLELRPAAAGDRRLTLRLPAAAVAAGPGRVDLALSGQPGVSVDVAAGDRADVVAGRLRAELAAWGIRCSNAEPAVVRVDGAPHPPPLAGIAVESDVPGLGDFELELQTPGGAPTPSVLVAPLGGGEDVLAAEIGLTDAATGRAARVEATPAMLDSAAEERRVASAGDPLRVRKARLMPTGGVPQVTAVRLAVHGAAGAFLGVDSFAATASRSRGSAPGGSPPPTLEVALDADGKPAELNLRSRHAGAAVLLVVGAGTADIRLDVIRKGARLLVPVRDSLMLNGRTDATGKLTIPLPAPPPAGAPIQVQALLLPAGAGAAELEVSQHLELAGG